MKVLPLFTSAYSFKSILTLDKPDKVRDGGADSIISLCKKNRIKKLFLVENSMAGFLQAVKGCDGKIDLAYGFRVNIRADISNKEPKDDTGSKYVIFANNTEGYKDLIKISTLANTEGLYEDSPSLDFQSLKKLWTENLTLVVPFYDSFIFKNSFYFSKCIPDFSFCKPFFIKEDNGLFFDERIRKKIDKYTSENNFETIEGQSIFYSKREDFLSWMTYRCIQNRTTLEVPNMDFCYSDSFSLEHWKERNK